MAIKKHKIAGQEVDWDTTEGAPVNRFSRPKNEAPPVPKTDVSKTAAAKVPDAKPAVTSAAKNS